MFLSKLSGSFVEEYSYLNELAIHPDNATASLQLGLLYAEQHEHVLAHKHLRDAVVNGNWSNVTAISNYALQLHNLNQTNAAFAILELSINLFHPRNPNLYLIRGILNLMTDNLRECHSNFREVLSIRPIPEFYIRIISSFTDRGQFGEAQSYIGRAIQEYPEHSQLLFICGVNFHYQSKYDLALELYHLSGKSNPNSMLVYINIASVYQVLGNLREAKAFYGHVLNEMRHDAGYLNNFGSLLLAMEEYTEGVRLLELSIEANSEQEHAYVNLAGYYQDEGLLEETEKLLSSALDYSSIFPQIELRIATLLSPVMKSWLNVLQERKRMQDLVAKLCAKPQPHERYYQPLSSALDRIHFYIQYHGLFDRNIQESMAHCYRKIIRDVGYVAESLDKRIDLDRADSGHLIRVGFMSKLFGIFEPHGLLLDGIIKYLPRNYFRVICLEIAPGGQQKIVSPLVKDVSDEFVQISMDHVHASRTLSALDLDILVFADVLSEPMNHFLLHSRFATVQIAFWGNPITSGSPHVDYFISSDFMEHPFRTRMLADQEPYSEQVVLTPGQGIWYFHPHSDEMIACRNEAAQVIGVDINISLSRHDFALNPEWFIFLCPQSLFKIHPLFDEVVAGILRLSQEAHVVFTGGRRQRWTDTFITRLLQAINPEDVPRCHIVDRVSSEQFIDFIGIADVLLHPFPFDGSRTSADSIAAGIPYVTLPTEYLRGRMGASFLRTMNMPDLVAKNVTDYLNKCVKLSTDITFYDKVKNDINERSWLIWEDFEVPFSWAKFLGASTGRSYTLTYEEFLKDECGDRNTTFEIIAHQERQRNQRDFDEKWGSPRWLLDNAGAAVLEENVEKIPRLFRNWA